MKKLKQYFITGVLAIVPVFFTLYFLIFIFKFCDNFLGRFINTYLSSKLGITIPGLGILLSLVIIVFTGFILTRLISKNITRQFEKWFESLPLIKEIYPAFKKLISFMLGQNEYSFQRVVLVEYPSKGLWSVGFLTNEKLHNIDKDFDRKMVAVFVPSSPGPLTGYVVFTAMEELKFPDISVRDALMIIISGGVFDIGSLPVDTAKNNKQ